MSAMTFAAFVFIATFLAALAGFRLQKSVPTSFTDDATEGNVKVVLGMLSMLTAVVLGFVTSDSKQSFDKAAGIVSDNAARLVSMDQSLAAFGPAALPIRKQIKQSTEDWIERIKSPLGDADADLGAVERGRQYEAVVTAIAELKPENTAQERAQARATEQAAALQHDRWVLTTERVAQSPTIFLSILLAWFAIEFFIFGLFANRNAVVTMATIFACVTMASSIYLILELEGPMTGQLRIPTRPLERAAAIMQH